MNLGDTINQNQFNVDEVHVHRHSEKHVTNNYYIHIVTEDHSTSHKAIEGMALGQGALLVLHEVNCFPVAFIDTRAEYVTKNTRRNIQLLFCAENDADDYDVTTDEFQKAVGALDQQGRVLLLTHPGPLRKSFISALRRFFRQKGFTVYDHTRVCDWDRKCGKDGLILVIFDSAFGDVRLDREQYCSFYQHKMHSINAAITKLVFVIYPHVLLELTQHDRASGRPVLDTMEVVELAQDPLVSLQPYADLLVRMLRDPNHGQMIGALLVLTMQGQGCFLNNPYQALPYLERFSFPTFSDTELQEYASLLYGFLLADSGRGFISRGVYDAAGMALGRSYLETVLLQVCDVRFLVQHVRTEHTTTDSSLVAGRRPDNGRLLMQRMCDDMVRGCLPEMIQHPYLHSQQFLQEFEAFCNEKEQLQRVLSAVDQQHSLPLLYWSVWGPSPCLTEWCLRLMMGQHTHENSVSDPLLRAAFAAAALRRCRDTDSPRLTTRLRDVFVSISETTSSHRLNLPIPSPNQRYTEDLDLTCRNIPLQLEKSPLCYLGDPELHIPNQLLTVRLLDDVMELLLPCQQPYLVLRLLTDRQVDEEDIEGNTLLHLAADTEHLEAIRLAIRSGASLTVKNKAGLTPPQMAARRVDSCKIMTKHTACELSTACSAGDMDQVKILLCHNAGVNDETDSGETALHCASKSGHTAIAALLVDLGADVNATDLWKQSPLHAACTGKHLDTVRLLVQRGAEVNIPDGKNNCPLHIACENGEKKMAEILLQHNADVSARRDGGLRPLHIACENGHLEVAELLLQYYADINGSVREDRYFFTVCREACRDGSTDLVKFLLRHNADVDLETADDCATHHLVYRSPTTEELSLCSEANNRGTTDGGQTALYLACLEGHTDFVRVLLTQTADVNIQGTGGDTALHAACYKGHTEIVRALLGHNAAVNAKDAAGHTPLHVACEAGHTETVRLLLQRDDTDVNTATGGRRSALHIACDNGLTEMARLLIQHNADVNISGPDSMTPMHLACEKGHAGVVELLLRHNADVNISERNGVTPLYCSCLSGHADVVDLLLRHNADVNISKRNGATPLYCSCLIGHADVVDLLLLHNADVNISKRNGATPLHWACDQGHTDVVNLLLRHNADVNISGPDGETPLHWACDQGHTDVVDLLLRHNADVNISGPHGVTPLHLACRKGHADVVDLLLRHNADVNISKRKGATPLHWACLCGHADVADLLPRHNADVNITGRHGKTPLHWACDQGHADVVHLLLQHSSDVNISGPDGETPMHRASDQGHADVVDLLLRHNADVNISGPDGETPLHRACDQGHADVVELLLRHNADVNIPKRNGATPLHCACLRGCADVVDLLLRHNADVNISKRNGATPLYCSCLSGHADVVDLLLRHGADVNISERNGATPLHCARLSGHADVVNLLLQHNANVKSSERNGETPLDIARSRGHADVVHLLSHQNTKRSLHFLRVWGKRFIASLRLNQD